jgi:hypothetical protein
MRECGWRSSIVSAIRRGRPAIRSVSSSAGFPRVFGDLALQYQYRLPPEQNDQFIRSERTFAQVWWNNDLNRFELLAWITASVDFDSGAVTVSEP